MMLFGFFSVYLLLEDNRIDMVGVLPELPTSSTRNTTNPIATSTDTNTSTSVDMEVDTIINTTPTIITSIPARIDQNQEIYRETQRISEPFYYTFNVSEVFEESGSPRSSASQYFWLNSGGKLIIEDGIGSTIVGALPLNDPWRVRYARSNPLATDNGAYPQNLFRLITRQMWDNIKQELHFSMLRVNAINTSDRDEFSGIFLMSRYRDSDNLYYAGIRMDGKAIIKKKYQGVYYTLAEAQLFSSDTPFDRVSNPNIIPTGTWYKMASNVITLPSGEVYISLSFAHSLSESMTTILTTTDSGLYWPPLVKAGHAGIRTDFADVLFDDYTIDTPF